ncbi:MAG: cyclase family protein [Parvibaculaceae bacterium]
MRKIVDLTLPIFTGLPKVPGTDRTIRVEPDMTFDTPYKRNTSRLFFHSHMCSTHIDAPKHALIDGFGIDKYSLEKHLTGEAYMLDFRHVPPGYRITIDDFKQAVEKTGKPFPRGCMLGINTAWTDRSWGKPEFFDQMISLATPGVGDWLAEQGPKAIMFDCYNDSWEGFMTADCFFNHKPLLRNEIPLIEFCCNMGELHGGKWEIFALPLKIVDCDGSPARVIAVARD